MPQALVDLRGGGARGERTAALWLQVGSLTLEQAGHALSRYEVEYATGGDRWVRVEGPRLFETPYTLPQPRLVVLSVLGEVGWLRALKLEDYAPRQPV